MSKDREHKKILYLMEYPIDLAGGGQMSTQTLCEGISAYSSHDTSVYGFESTEDNYVFDPVVVCPTLLSKTADDYPFTIITYESDENRELSKLSRIKNFFGRIASFYSIIRREKPDLIHISMSESVISYGFLRCLGFFKNIPFVYTDRGLCYGYRRHSKFCILQTMKRAAYMLTTTQYNKGLWDKENVACPIRVIPNTISSAFDKYDDTMRKQMRDRFGIKDGELVIGFAGRISEEKDWPSVGGIVKALADSHVSFKVALVLSVYEDRDAAIVEDIKASITEHIGSDNLIYMQDLSQAEISDYYYMVDIFVMTSNFESFGKAAVEAMSRKCAVLSTAVGGLPEVLGKDENLYDKKDLQVFTNRVKELLDAGCMQEEREYFYNRYKGLFTKEANVYRHIELYKEILGIQ